MLGKDYKVGDIVMVKDKNQSWPGFIQSIANKDNDTLYNVTYLHKDQSQEVTSRSFVEFNEKGSKRARSNRRHKNRSLRSSAVSAALRIIKGESTLEGTFSA